MAAAEEATTAANLHAQQLKAQKQMLFDMKQEMEGLLSERDKQLVQTNEKHQVCYCSTHSYFDFHNTPSLLFHQVYVTDLTYQLDIKQKNRRYLYNTVMKIMIKPYIMHWIYW